MTRPGLLVSWRTQIAIVPATDDLVGRTQTDGPVYRTLTVAARASRGPTLGTLTVLAGRVWRRRLEVVPAQEQWFHTLLRRRAMSPGHSATGKPWSQRVYLETSRCWSRHHCGDPYFVERSRVVADHAGCLDVMCCRRFWHSCAVASVSCI